MYSRQRLPDMSIEVQIGSTVAGIDEAGRGPLAGPVIAAAVVLDPDCVPSGIRDSKTINQSERNQLYKQIRATAKVGTGIATVSEIDRINILQATLLAMRRAIMDLTKLLGRMPDAAIVDGNQKPDLPCPTFTLVQGDTRSLSVAAASIIAKVTRDNLMQALAIDFPGYGWKSNSGYDTKEHRLGLTILGQTPHHRHTFRPMKPKLH